MVLKPHAVPAALTTNQLRAQFAYQPFELPDGTVTGTGLSMKRRTPTGDVTPEKMVEFLEASRAQARMYEDIISGIKGNIASFAGLTYLDIACNAGYFCYRMLQEGCVSATGVDANNFGVAFTAANHALELNAVFVNGSYDMMTHKLPVDGDFDIVSCVAFMCHCSDPTYLLAALAARARKALVVFSSFSTSDDLVIRYTEDKSRYFHQPFPICFDSATEISERLLRTGMAHLGFNLVAELPRQEYWVPRAPNWRCFIGIR